MNKTLISLLVAAAVGIAAVGIPASEYEAEHQNHEQEQHGERDHERGERRGGSSFADLSDPQHVLYKTECGDCHMAYPPSMLPATPWNDMVGSLEDHFGDNAELDAATAERIAAFLADNAAGKGRGEYAERSWRATRGRTAPMRITQTDYFLGQHHEIPAKMVTGNPDVVSFSRCEICHRGADQGGLRRARGPHTGVRPLG